MKDVTIRNAFHNALLCWKENNCSMYPTRDTRSCQMKKCKKETNALFESYSCGTERKLLSSCVAMRETDVCPMLDTWAIILFAISIFLSYLHFFFFFFFFAIVFVFCFILLFCCFVFI